MHACKWQHLHPSALKRHWTNPSIRLRSRCVISWNLRIWSDWGSQLSRRVIRYTLNSESKDVKIEWLRTETNNEKVIEAQFWNDKTAEIPSLSLHGKSSSLPVTSTSKVQVPILPAESMAVHTTVLGAPCLKREPDEGTHPTKISPLGVVLSVAVTTQE